MVSCGNKVSVAYAMLWLLYCIHTLLYLCMNALLCYVRPVLFVLRGLLPMRSLFSHCSIAAYVFGC